MIFKMTKFKKMVAITVGVFLISIFVLLIYSNIKIGNNEVFTKDSIDQIEPSYSILILGTSKLTKGDRRNLYFDRRIKAGYELYSAGKCQKIVVSGDNGRKNYNEPEDMKSELVKMGVPEDNIICDYAGFRTLDSVVRFKEIFGQESGIVVSQQFHNERAIYIAQANGINLTGFNADDVEGRRSYKTRFRELFSRVKCILDVHIFGTDPKFYGEKIKI